jgi:excisionase family DNA binding protein
VSDEILTIKEVASFLKVHERTVYRLAAKGDIPAFKVANTWRFRQEDIDHWITQQTSLPSKVNGTEGDV